MNELMTIFKEKYDKFKPLISWSTQALIEQYPDDENIISRGIIEVLLSEEGI